MAPIVRVCCCGCTLEVGTRIIAVWLMISCAYGIGNSAHEMPTLENFFDGTGYIYATFVINGIYLLVNIGLFVATFTENTSLAMAWIVCTVCEMAYAVGAVIYVGITIARVSDDQVVTSAVTGSIIGSLAVSILLQIYFIIVVWSWKEQVLSGFDTFVNQPGAGPNVVVVNTTTAVQQALPPAGYGQPPFVYGQPQPGYGQQPPPYGQAPGAYGQPPAQPAMTSEKGGVL